MTEAVQTLLTYFLPHWVAIKSQANDQYIMTFIQTLTCSLYEIAKREKRLT